MMTVQFGRMMCKVAPVLAMAAMIGLSACNSADAQLSGRQGVPLSELNMSGAAPDAIALMGPDRVLISQGAAFDIDVEGSASDTQDLRFLLEDGELGISRENGSWKSSSSITTIRVTLPEAPGRLTLAGSGEIASERLANAAEIVIAGSGNVSTPSVAAETLEISIVGSGRYRAAGSARQLDLSVAGSGNAELAGLKADRADVSIAGSGDTVFASDGEVDASFMGSGNVTVRGAARCTVSSMGSGKLTCERADAAA